MSTTKRRKGRDACRDQFSSPACAVRELKRLVIGPHISPGAPFSTLTAAQVAEVGEAFRIWWDSYVAPCIDTLERSVIRQPVDRE